MNENIDLTKILKDCPKGWKFYSSVFGDVEFLAVDYECTAYPIRFTAYGAECFVSSAGEHNKGMGECTFFSSRDQRDWSKFTAPWYKKERFDPKTLLPFDKVLVRDRDDNTWKCGFFSHIGNEYNRFPCITIASCYRCCIPYNDDTNHLVGTTEEAPEYYRYWED